MNSLRFNAVGNLSNSSVNVPATAKITGVFNENVFSFYFLSFCAKYLLTNTKITDFSKTPETNKK